MATVTTDSRSEILRGGDLYSVLSNLENEEFARRMSPCVEAGSNTSTVALRVVGGNGKGSLESETAKYGHESHESRTRK
jgi:hypothetical protein